MEDLGCQRRLKDTTVILVLAKSDVEENWQQYTVIDLDHRRPYCFWKERFNVASCFCSHDGDEYQKEWV